MLDEYLQQSQRLIRDQQERLINIEDLVHYCNRARREVAMRSQSIRVLSPISGSVASLNVANPGQNYTAPVVVITPPDAPSGMLPNPGGAQAFATATVSGGMITGVTLVDGGDGYFQPLVNIVDPTGVGADITAEVTPMMVTQGMQEVYPFTAVPLDQFPGVKEVFAAKSISFIYANYRYSVPVYPFSFYQAFVRIYPQQYLYVPTVAAQFGQGVNGSIYMYPIPSYVYQCEIDCFCLPYPLETDDDFEAIPMPWTECVPFYAAHLAFLELQNLNAAKFYLDLYDNLCHRYSSYSRPGRMTNPYGRGYGFM
jgi:hypothetical protein